MKPSIYRSYAKINLFLHVLGKRPDGYHSLESLFYFPNIFDEIEIIEGAKEKRLEVNGQFADRLQNNLDDNLIIKTYKTLKNLHPNKIPELSFKLTKNLPVASGIGGGSANAATILRELSREYNLGLSYEELFKIGVEIGADVPACVLSRPCFAKGIGESISEVVEMHKLNILMVNPLKPVATAEIFKMGFERFSKPIKKELGFRSTQSLIDFLENTRNDLELNAKKLCPEITGILETISKQGGCLFSRMSGSGATCFGIFETSDKANTAKENILKDNPSYWVAVG